jgi:hypothetical protein
VAFLVIVGRLPIKLLAIEALKLNTGVKVSLKEPVATKGNGS